MNKQPKRQQRLYVPLPPETYTQLQDYCYDRELNVARTVGRWVTERLDKELDGPEPDLKIGGVFS